ncbi:gamma-parvin isoform X6 [Canis aureus]
MPLSSPTSYKNRPEAYLSSGAGTGEMEPESFYNLLQRPKVAGPPAEEELPQGEKKKYLPPTSRGDPKFEELQKVLMEWINAKLLPEHIVVRSLEEDIFDGLILHHLFQTLTGLKLEVEEMALTAPSQRRKLEVVLEAVNGSLQVGEQQLKWSVATIFSKDLLATLHLLVALAKRFQPDLPLPTNVQVEVITMESTKSGLKSEKSVEQLTECRQPLPRAAQSPPEGHSTGHPALQRLLGLLGAQSPASEGRGWCGKFNTKSKKNHSRQEKQSERSQTQRSAYCAIFH